MNPKEQERISRHEAGHTVVAIHEGFETNATDKQPRVIIKNAYLPE